MGPSSLINTDPALLSPASLPVRQLKRAERGSRLLPPPPFIPGALTARVRRAPHKLLIYKHTYNYDTSK